MATKRTYADLGLLVNEPKSDGQYISFSVSPVVIGTERHLSVRNQSSDPWNAAQQRPLYVADLKITAQGDNTNYKGEPVANPKLYGFSNEFRDLFSVDERKAVAIAKTLSTLTKKLNKLYDVRGPVVSFGEHVARVGEVLGAKYIVVNRDGSGRGWSYDEQEFRFLTLGDGRRHIEDLEQKWKDRVSPKPPALLDVDARLGELADTVRTHIEQVESPKPVPAALPGDDDRMLITADEPVQA